MKSYEKYKPTGIPWLPQVPEHWGVEKIGLHFQERNIKVSDKDYPPLSVAKIGCVPQLDDVALSNAHDSRKLVKKGDFVINSRSDRKGSSGISEQNGSVSLINIVLNPYDLKPRYTHLLLRSHNFIEEFYRNGRGLVADLWTTRYAELKNIFIPIPDSNEQEQIAKYLDWKTADIARLVAAKKKQIKLLDEQKRTIINQAVTKGLDPTVEFKDSGIPWLGQIPAHWEQFSLFQCAEEQTLSNKTEHNQNLLSLSYGKIISKDINTTTGLLPASFDTYQIVHNGNIVLRLTDLQNDKVSLRVGLSTQTGIITSAYTCLKERANAVPKFLYYLLHAYDLRKVFYGMGGGLRQSIGFKELRKLTTFLPHESEQNLIIKLCENKETVIDKTINAIKREIALLQEYRTRLISDAVTGQIDLRNVAIPENITTVIEEEIEVENEETEVKENDD